jgi:predicted deacylase
MRVERLGDGEPEIAIVAGIHGDEPCGVRAVERLLDERPAVRRPVKLVVANEEAIERGVRYVDEDLNRSFPGDPDADTHEGRLAHVVGEELADCLTLSMHSTQSYAEPFAIVESVTDDVRRLCPHLPVRSVVETGGFVDGRLFVSVDRLVEVECGLQGSEQAAQNAVSLARDFLTVAGALPGDTVPREMPVFRLVEQVAKAPAEQYEVFVENFERVERGERFAAAGGTDHVADDAFYPVLMSSYGYDEVFGYAADRVGTLSG